MANPTVLNIPPNGFVGAAVQSPAVRNHIASHMMGASAVARKPRKSRAKKPKTSRTKKKSSTHVSSRAAKGGAVMLKAGSPAAKAWGAKMKRLRAKKAKTPKA